VLLGLVERAGWVTNHGSTVQVITPYDGGKREDYEQFIPAG
jgi:hypothetical protein